MENALNKTVGMGMRCIDPLIIGAGASIADPIGHTRGATSLIFFIERAQFLRNSLDDISPAMMVGS